ncbi:hypothetical protein GCM10008967_14400 [Bacillus carboniphilus]|uniref:Short-chain dehydrogenase n=1 Tax=Bacillus carboniphilus TaxID=86663 RepID=A0ABN0W4L8_9BACI
MSQFIIILALAAVVISIFSLVFTFSVARERKVVRGELDTKIPESVKDHPFTLNPVFLSYIIGLGVVLLFIIYLAFKFY